MAEYSKKMEEAIAEAMALTEPQKMSLITGPPNCKCPLCRPNDLFIDGVNMSADSTPKMQGLSVAKIWLDEIHEDEVDRFFADALTEGNSTPEAINTEPATANESRNPFAVIADWLRGNLRSEEPSPVEFATGGIVGRGYFYEPDEDEEIIPLSNFVANSAPRAFLINPRTGESAEIPMQSFELGGWEPSDDTTFEEDCDTEELRTLSMESHPSYARKSVSWEDGEMFKMPQFIVDEIIRQGEAVSKMQSILSPDVEESRYALDDLVIISREELTRLRNFGAAYDQIRNIVKE